MISFIILHYKNIKDTIECLKSIKNLNEQKKITIIVVDNNTLNETETKEIKKYTKDIIKLEENKGFAMANNIACNYAKEKYQPKYLCVINNDIVIEQKDFIKRIEELDKKYKFDILGPKINTNQGNSVNPFYAYSNLDEIKQKIKETQRLQKIYSNKFMGYALELSMKIKRIFRKPKILTNGEKEVTQVALHGCSIIFSEKYYKKFKNVFYPNTFLYHEEEFIFYRINKYNLKSVYSPYIEVFHKEGASLDTRFENKLFEKKKFRYSYIEDSLQKLEKLYENEGVNDDE